MSDVLQVRFAGTGGQGLQLSARVLAEALLREGRVIALSQSYEPTSRGGLSRSDIVIGDVQIDFPLVSALDLLIVLDQVAMVTSVPLLKCDGTVLADADKVEVSSACSCTTRVLPLTAVARSLGNERVANSVALGALVRLSGLCSRQSLEVALIQEAPPKLVDLNIAAIEAGIRLIDNNTSVS